MESQSRQICPWCNTEIVWDPEIGPENECPHCFNELGAYRTIKLKLKSGEPLSLDEEDEEEADRAHDADGFDLPHLGEAGDELLDDYDDDAAEYRDEYDIKVEQCIDFQEEAPECGSCRELMLLAGHRTVSGDFAPVAPKPLGRAFLTAPYKVDVYVCPSCFRTGEFLSQEIRLRMMNILKGKEQRP